ncbi:MAG TPA: class I SAM-dependent methyltransferase [Blastocatellia bacterium]|nr:class I SAM-dependent methyltransferase [Blastocatellia bacterium]
MPWALGGLHLGDHVLEVGPGPGLTTDILRTSYSKLTSIEIDSKLAGALKERMTGTNVAVVHGDATDMPFDDASFSGAVCFTMLHHVPSVSLQDELLAEVCRVLKPGGVFAGSDSRTSLRFRFFHIWDVMVPIDPDTFGARLERAGFSDVSIKATDRAFKFRARRS